ncbi:iron ABC transporter ATP-binding protein [Spirochaetia bacterium]|nr:iron ABC transporter ATP-binding protein [Spirochaetia bacterium]
MGENERPPLLEVRDLSFAYEKGRDVFTGVNFTLKAGEIYTILGANGAGKSTLLACLECLLIPRGGSILLDGEDARLLSPTAYALKVGVVAQNRGERFDFSVRDYLCLGHAPRLGLLKVPGLVEYEVVDRVMEQMGITHLAHKSILQISGGEYRQTQIARVLVQNPRLMLMDEPTNHLDYGNQIKVLKTIVGLAEEGIAVILTTHTPDHAILLDTKAGILGRDGRLTSGSAEEIITRENLMGIYQTDMCLSYIPEIGRRVCAAHAIRQGQV